MNHHPTRRPNVTVISHPPRITTQNSASSSAKYGNDRHAGRYDMIWYLVSQKKRKEKGKKTKKYKTNKNVRQTDANSRGKLAGSKPVSTKSPFPHPCFSPLLFPFLPPRFPSAAQQTWMNEYLTPYSPSKPGTPSPPSVHKQTLKPTRLNTTTKA